MSSATVSDLDQAVAISSRSARKLASRYEEDGTDLVLPEERGLAALYRRPYWEWSLLPVEAREWLVCQAVLNDLVTAAVNGEHAGHGARGLTSLAYRFCIPIPAWWRGGVAGDGCRPLLGGRTAAGRLSARLLDRPVDMATLVKALQEAEAFMMEPPRALRCREHTLQFSDNVPDWVAASPLRGLSHPLRSVEDRVSLYVHGSQADGYHTAFSDIDDLVIVHPQAWRSLPMFQEVVRRLERLARALQKHDPLQHHGHIVLLEFDLVCLDQSILPLVVIAQAVRLVGQSQVRVRAWTDVTGLGRNLWALVQSLRRDVVSVVQGYINLYHLKRLVSTISLLPAVVMQVEGEMVDKRTALNQVAETFPPEVLPAVCWATTIRREWASLNAYQAVAILQRVNRLVPFRRNELEAVARRCFPVLRARAIPYLTEEVLAAIFRFGDECVRRLAAVLRRRGVPCAWQGVTGGCE